MLPRSCRPCARHFTVNVKRFCALTGAITIGESHVVPKSVVDMSMVRTSTKRRARSWNRSKPSRFARRVRSSSTPVAMNAKCAGGRLMRAAVSKSKTFNAGSGDAIVSDG